MQVPPTIEQEKSHALRVVQSFLLGLEKATDAYDIETQIYGIFRTAESAFQRIHLINEQNRRVMRTEVQP